MMSSWTQAVTGAAWLLTEEARRSGILNADLALSMDPE